jgi:neurotransmitter:Na+ symporter, NSS family
MKKNREHWASSFGFIMAAAGSAIGLGTLWQFPYMTSQNGGGLFVLLFLFFTVIIGIPIFIAELLLGRKAQRGAVGTFETLSNSPQWKGVGWLAVLSSFLILAYYCVVAGWGLNYVLLSLNKFYENKTSAEISNVFKIMFKSPDINILWQIIFLTITAGVVLKGIRKGIEYWSRILTSSLLVLLLCMFFYSLTLKGFPEALKFIFYPDLSNLRPSGVLEALGLAFFTLSLGQGVMLTYGSYMSKKEDIPKTATIIASMNVVVSLFAALMIFPIIFTFGFEPEGDFGLVFETLPVLFAKLPGSLVLSTVFFILLVFTALTSSVALFEVGVANLEDLLSWSRKKAVLIAAIAIFIVGIPIALTGSEMIFPNWEALYGKSFFKTVVDLVAQWILPFCGLFVAIFTGWKMNKVDLKEEFAQGTSWIKIFSVWFFFTKWVAPIAIIVIILQRGGLIDLDQLFQSN